MIASKDALIAAKVYPTSVHSSGGITYVHDYKMSDGSIKTMSEDEARKMRQDAKK